MPERAVPNLLAVASFRLSAYLDAAELAQQLHAAGLHQRVWEQAQGSLSERDNEWLGL